MEGIGVVLHHELKGRYSTQTNSSPETVAELLDKRGDPFQSVAIAPLYNSSTGEIVQQVTGRFIRYFSYG